MNRALAVGLFGLAIFGFTCTLVFADCTKDTDCKRSRIGLPRIRWTSLKADIVNVKREPLRVTVAIRRPSKGAKHRRCIGTAEINREFAPVCL